MDIGNIKTIERGHGGGHHSGHSHHTRHAHHHAHPMHHHSFHSPIAPHHHLGGVGHHLSGLRLFSALMHPMHFRSPRGGVLHSRLPSAHSLNSSHLHSRHRTSPLPSGSDLASSPVDPQDPQAPYFNGPQTPVQSMTGKALIAGLIGFGISLPLSVASILAGFSVFPFILPFFNPILGIGLAAANTSLFTFIPPMLVTDKKQRQNLVPSPVQERE